MRAVAVYDACVLYPSTLRDVLIRAAMAGLVRAKWSEQILDEVYPPVRAAGRPAGPARRRPDRHVGARARRRGGPRRAPAHGSGEGQTGGFDPMQGLGVHDEHALHLPFPDGGHLTLLFDEEAPADPTSPTFTSSIGFLDPSAIKTRS